jgi:hypothetical protein
MFKLTYYFHMTTVHTAALIYNITINKTVHLYSSFTIIHKTPSYYLVFNLWNCSSFPKEKQLEFFHSEGLLNCQQQNSYRLSAAEQLQAVSSRTATGCQQQNSYRLSAAEQLQAVSSRTATDCQQQNSYRFLSLFNKTNRRTTFQIYFG